MCREQGMAKLGNVAIDGTKVRANASKHKAMSYGRMKKKRDELDEIVKGWLDEAERIDAEEDKLYGKGKRGDELPEKFRDPKTRRANIEKALRELEARKKAEAEKKRAEIAEKEEKKREKERETGKKQPGRKTKPPSEEPDDKMQYPQVRTAGRGGPSGQLHRSGVPHHEDGIDRIVRAVLQRAGRCRCRHAGDRCRGRDTAGE